MTNQIINAHRRYSINVLNAKSAVLMTVIMLSSVSLVMADTNTRDSQTTIYLDPDSPQSGIVKHAVAILYPTENNSVNGTIEFTEQDDKPGVYIKATLQNLPEGDHGYHIHLLGDCSSNNGESAGTHFNFEGSAENPPKDIQRITGNLGIIHAGKDGSAEDTAYISEASLQGAYSIVGRSVIIHEKSNDT